jgi:hypothetical protein
MWIITTEGFFSIVRKPGDEKDGILTVRGRVRADLESLKSRFLPKASQISEDERADYRYRFRAKASDIGQALGCMAGGIDYENFKDAVGERQGWTRYEIYGLVWQVLCQLSICDAGLKKQGVKSSL